MSSKSCEPIGPRVTTNCNCQAQVLLVDDSEFNLEILAAMLNQVGIKVETATNGEEAIQMYIDNLQRECCNVYYRVVFMDIQMPVLDGHKASIGIREAYRSFLEMK